MLDYTKYHFANEEEFMKSIAYPDLENHKKEHEAFTQRASEFYNKFSQGKLILSLEVTNFIKNWITNHVQSEDKQYAIFAGLKSE